MLREAKIVFAFVCCLVLASIPPAFAVEEFRVSQYNDGHQIWFEAEAFDDRSPNKNYKLGIEEGVLKPTDGAFGDIVTNAGGSGWLLYTFDISRCDGEGGQWRFIGRIINPNNASDWIWVRKDEKDEIPQAMPNFVRPDDIIFENDTPNWAWVRDGDFGADGGTVQELQDGENVMMIWTRGSDRTDQYDVFMWADDLAFQPTDEDYINAEPKTSISVNPAGSLTTTWGRIKSAG